MKILVVGGAGYVGSHAVHELLKNGYEVVVYDNLSSGFRESLPERDIRFIHGDLNNIAFLESVFNSKNIVYSSSASVYGQPKKIPILEEHYTNATSVYGETKSIAERMLKFFDEIYGIKSIS